MGLDPADYYTIVLWTYVATVVCFGIWSRWYIKRERKRKAEEEQKKQNSQE